MGKLLSGHGRGSWIHSGGLTSFFSRGLGGVGGGDETRLRGVGVGLRDVFSPPSLKGQKMKYTLRLEYDPDVECPNSDYAWKLISFHRKHINYQSPEKFIKALDANGEVIPAEVGLREK